MNVLKRSALAASSFKLAGLAAINAEAAIVVTTFTTPVVANNTAGPVFFDLDGDTNPDFAVFHGTDVGSNDGQTDAVAFVAAGGNISVDPVDTSFAVPYAAGTLIPGVGVPGPKALLAGNVDSPPRTGNIGYWANGGADPSNWPGAGQGFRGFMGFSFFDSNSDEHFAWADLGVHAYADGDMSSYEITVYGYGYETAANTPLPAGVPEPGSLATLAAGAAALVARKRRAGKRAA